MLASQQFRLWARRAPVGERVSAALGAAIVLAMVAWLVVPPTSETDNASLSNAPAATGSETTTGAAGSAAGGNSTGAGGNASTGASSNAPGATTGAGAGPGVIAGSGGAGGASANQPSNGRVTNSGPAAGCKSGTDQGVSASEIRVAVMLPDDSGSAANQAVGGPTAEQSKQNYQDVIDSVNAAGGAACRKIKPSWFITNGLDSAKLQQTCFDVQQAKVFAVLDVGIYGQYPALASCYPQARIPYFGAATRLPKATVNKYYPYMFINEVNEVLYKNTVFALKQHGFFGGPNFTKLGVLYRDCIPQSFPYVVSMLKQVGLQSSQIVSYNVGCPSLFASPDQLQNAILKFQQNNVHHVTLIGELADWGNFTNLAEQQGFKPLYGIPDEQFISINKSPGFKPNYDNVANALAVTSGQIGEETTPGMKPSPATAKCNAIYAARGRPPVYKADALGVAGYVCNQVWQFAAAVDHAPALARSALAQGLHAAKSVPYSWPLGPNNFTGNRVTYGGQFWRIAKSIRSCECWRVIDPAFRPSF